jgi:diguanylate cyclase (GGDEF)-like protein
MPSIPPYLAKMFALALLLGALGFVAVAAHPADTSTIIYPATGVGFAILWRFGARWWPALLIAQFGVSFYASNGSITVATITAAIELLTCLALLQLLSRQRVSPDLARTRDLLPFTIGTLIVTGIAGLAIAVSEWFYGEGPLRIVARDGAYWWAGDAISITVFTPLVTTWRTWPFLRSSRFRLVAALSILLLALGIAITLGGEESKSALFLLLPIVIVNALLAGVAGAASSGALLTATLLGFAMSGANQFDLIVRLIFVATATITGYVLGIVWTEREQAGHQLEHLARHDMLTGIFNRYEFESRLRDALSRPGSGVHALLYLDLDEFKLVNDTCGHMAGDSMLKEVAQQLALVLPQGATLARLGGDEFGCLLPNADEPAALRIAEDVHRATERYRFRFNQSEFGVTVSIGITIFGNADGDTSDSILSRADIACYLAKEEGHSETRVYRPADEAMLSWHAAIHEVSQVEHALASGKLSLFCQQIVAIGKRIEDPHLYEVLLRLHEGGRWQSASEFLPLVQRFGLMERIDRWVLEKTCEFLASSGDPQLRLSINVSGATLNQPSFFEFAMKTPERYGIDASRICLEVTEAVAIQRLRQAVEAMHKLRARGFDIALDDFGAGVASFGYLHELPVTMVKLDGRFVRDLRSDPAAEVIIDSLVRIAELRGVTCVAEWVESEESIEQLRRLGVSYAQGYFIGMPKPLGELLVTAPMIEAAPAVAFSH